MVKKFLMLGIIMCGAASGTVKKAESKAMLTVTANDFRDGQPLEPIHSLKEGNKAPELSWSGAPASTQSLVLIVDDPDAPGQTWVHWVLFNIPATVHSLPDSIGRKRSLADGTTQGINDFEKIGYDGPYPPKRGSSSIFLQVVCT